MSQIGRSIKHLEAPRPLKSSTRQIHSAPMAEIKSIEELMTLTEKMATALGSGHTNADSMNILLTNLRTYGPELEVFYKDALDRAFVAFRNASQDERLSIISRMNLLELIELRAKSWQVTDETNTYYKHKATDVQPDSTSGIIDLTLGTSPPASSMAGPQILSPGELIRTSGKFPKPTKIPGKNYSKDEVVIRNADSGKVMGIKGRRVHMIEELSETIISFQRVNPGAKERLVQITGPSEDKINYAKQLIEDTIRRNASPVRLDGPQGGSCSSLASSASDEAIPRTNRNSTIAASSNSMPMNNFNLTNQSSGGMVGSGGANSGGAGTITGGMNIKMPRNSGGGNSMLLHSLSTNDASLGEYKYTVGVGQHNIKITGDCFELVRIAKLVLDDYFSSNEFLRSVETGASFDSGIAVPSSVSTPTSTSFNFPANIPVSHKLNSSSPFADSGIGLNIIASSASGKLIGSNNNKNYTEEDDDVFIIENTDSTESTNSSCSTNSTVATVTTTPLQQTQQQQQQQLQQQTSNGLTRSRRSHFSRKDSTPEGNQTKNSTVRIVHKYERLILYAKSPHSWALPKNWTYICDSFPSIIRNKDTDDDKNRFDADKYLSQIKTRNFGKMNATTAAQQDDSSESPDRE